MTGSAQRPSCAPAAHPGRCLSQWDLRRGLRCAWQLSSSTRYDNGNAYTTTIGGYSVRYQPTTTTVTIPSNE